MFFASVGMMEKETMFFAKVGMLKKETMFFASLGMLEKNYWSSSSEENGVCIK